MKGFKLMLSITLVFHDKYKAMPKSLHYLVVILIFLTYYDRLCLDLKKKTETCISKLSVFSYYIGTFSLVVGLRIYPLHFE